MSDTAPSGQGHDGKRRSHINWRIEPIEPPRGALAGLSPKAAAVMPMYDLYFVLSESGFIKIGYAKDARSRLSNMQTGCPEPLHMLGIIETCLPSELERDLHTHFADIRVRGEWFKCTDELVDYVLKHGRALWEDDEPSPSA